MVSLAMAAPAIGQEGNPGGAEPGVDVNAADRVFVMAAAQGGMAEVELAKLAGKAARSKAVKEFADRMEKDHGKANSKLKSIAGKEGIALPKDVGPDHKALTKKLKGLSGAQFDLAYMKAQVSEHQKTVQLLAHESTAGQNAALKEFAVEVLPVVLQHLDMAQETMETLSGQVTR
jgi:putative membrane protein